MSLRLCTIGLSLLLLCATGCPSEAPGLGLGITAEQHNLYFPISNGKPHALGSNADDGVISCASCHGNEGGFDAVTCLSCHEHEQNAMNAKHAGLESYRYETARCLSCHPTGDSSAEISVTDHTASYFPIDAASAHAPIGCAQCHTSAADRSVVTCTGCHDHDAGPMLEVHGTMPGYTWDTASCRSCHARAENPGQLSHTFFPTSTGQVHEGISCAECHSDRRDRGALACITCHAHEQPDMDAAHDGVPDYAYDSGSCFLCHNQAEVPGVLQHGFFPIDAPATHTLGTTVDTPAVTISCATCHTEPTDRATVGCTGCHAHAEDVLLPSHNGIQGYVWNSSSCLFCHPNGEPQGLITHDDFPITATDAHAGVSCRECHASVTNRSSLLCAGCHTIAEVSPTHAGMPGYQFQSTACQGCHPSAQVPGLFDHEPLFPLRAPSGNGEHAALQCVDCHQNPARRTEVGCTTCHVTLPGDNAEVHASARLNPLHSGVSGYTFSSTSCVTCHPDGTAENAVFEHTQFPIGAGTVHEVKSGGVECIDCHTNPADNSIVSCTTCHTGTHDQQPMAQQHQGVPGYAWNTTQCLFCHPNGEGAAVNIDHEQYFPIAVPAAHAGVGCSECHTDANNRAVLGCAQCHAGDAVSPTAVHAGIDGFANNSTACRQCHDRAQNPGDMDHNAYFPIQTGTAHASNAYRSEIAAGDNSCEACHSSRSNRATMLCAECHTGVSPVPTQAHGQVREFNNTSTSCKLCHADAQVDRLNNHDAFNPRHEGSSCTDCHRQRRADKPWAINFDVGVCTRCHSAACTPNNQGPCD